MLYFRTKICFIDLLRGQDTLSSKQEVTQENRIKQKIKTSNITKT